MGSGGLQLEDLTSDQRMAIEMAKTGDSIFFTGSAGTGKSTVLNLMIRELRRQGKSVDITASTGAAATLVGGGTLHSWAGVGLAKDPPEKLGYMARGNKKAAGHWKNTDVLVIDEISMIGEGVI